MAVSDTFYESLHISKKQEQQKKRCTEKVTGLRVCECSSDVGRKIPDARQGVRAQGSRPLKALNTA